MWVALANIQTALKGDNMTKSGNWRQGTVIAAALAIGALATPAAVHAMDLTGNISVLSKYVFRGNTATPENEGAVVQGGLELGMDSGIYLGWWGSSLGESYAPGDDDAGAFENDFYAGWTGNFGPVAASAGLLYYYYVGSSDSDTLEATATLGYGAFELGLNYMLTDADWSNAGDTYLTASYSFGLPYKLTLSALAGYYIYSDNGDFEEDLTTTEGDAFRHLDLTLTAPVGNTGAEMSVTYTVGGKLRDGTDLGNTMILGLSYAFGL